MLASPSSAYASGRGKGAPQRVLALRSGQHHPVGVARRKGRKDGRREAKRSEAKRSEAKRREGKGREGKGREGKGGKDLTVTSGGVRSLVLGLHPPWCWAVRYLGTWIDSKRHETTRSGSTATVPQVRYNCALHSCINSLQSPSDKVIESDSI